MKKRITREELYDEELNRLKSQVEMANRCASYWYNEYEKLAQTFKDFKGKYGTYEELSKLYEDSHANYLALSKILDTTVGRLAYQNMMLDKAREAYKYITSEDRDHE